MTSKGPDIARSALIIVDMQNDFVHPDGGFAHRARENAEAEIDMPFLMGTIPQVKRLADAFRKAGRPVVYVAHVLKPDYSDAQFPYWRATRGSLSTNRTFITEGTWGAQIIDELKPNDGEHLVVKKGFGGFSNTIRGGVEHNYRMILASDAVAEVHRDTHEAELKTMQRVFAEVKTVDEI